jgi:hypothetical protein
MATPANKSSTFSVILLAIFCTAILIFLVVLISFIQNPSPISTLPGITAITTFTSQPTIPPTSTSTITLTPRPTWTLRPSATATNTATPSPTYTQTLIPTITNAIPARVNTFYSLKSWGLSEQERTIEQLKADTILLGTDDSFRTLAYAEGEAGLRFPDAINAINWRWDRAYNLIRVGDPQGLSLYADLFQSAISTGQVRVTDLTQWFSQYETRLTLITSSLAPQPGELTRTLIEIIGEGSAYLWLIETPSDVKVYPLMNDIDYGQSHENAYLYADLTADSSPDLVIYRNTSPGSTQLIIPKIFDLAVEPPLELPFQEQVPTDLGLEPVAEAEVISGTTGLDHLQFTNSLLPACPTDVTQNYSWDGTFFKPSDLQYETRPLIGMAEYCELVLETATNSWDPGAAINVALPMLEVWPPEKDIQGKPYPPDARDELRYRLGILYALNGQSSPAIEYLSGIVTQPSVPDSSWIGPAQKFLDAYQVPQDLFIACQQALYCNLRDAFRTMVATSGLDEPGQVSSYLQENGVTIRSRGVFDFDQDGEDEHWLIIQPKPGSKLEFWIISEFLEGVQAVFVQVIEGTESLPYYHEPAGTIPVVQFELQKGFIFKRLVDTFEPYIEWVDVEYARPTAILDGYTKAVNALMAGEDPKVIQQNLLQLLNSPRFKGDCIAFRICDQFHYTLGFVYDLNGEDGNAVDQYMWVWRNYPQSPYTKLARLKLDYFPLPTYTRSPVPSITPTRTRTPSPITPTKSQTSTPTNTSTPTFTFTPTSTPTPTDTPTSTPTSTP